ncbi:MAG: hypothetical protein BLM47_05145 [Candidatus Reconcilbacillus cellulovorans]|uniref:Peptidase M20 dimerisation domain-containing protein n=1 Tax=Candidatus Reconcilbacillus cellulovorans TaxID=1906605 RepID=A0A2A6E248_9BACL|nr:MAG: hypothetical protein BLM47_05145 [Candidatus Reconcilbacillus cellulovorans]
MIDEKRLVEEFLELVRVDSESGREGPIASLLKAKLEKLGLDVREDDAARKTGHGANNLVATLRATDPDPAVPKIFFACHMDTVRPGSSVRPRLDDDGYIRSDGTTVLGSDDKAGIAALLEMVRVLRERSIPHGQIQLLLTVGEESGLVGAKALDPSLLDAQFGYALDSNGKVGDIAVAAPSQAKIRIAFIGRAAHAGVNPEDGISAIQVASKAVARMRLGRIDAETTANVGRFEGGGETNIVCERVDVYAEARSLDPHKLEKQVASMRAASEEAAREHGATMEFVSEIVFPSFRFDESAPVVRYASAAARAIGRTPKLFQTGGGSDANILNGYGFPTVNLAVGYENIHTTKEQIAVSELVAAARWAVAIAEEVRRSAGNSGNGEQKSV